MRKKTLLAAAWLFIAVAAVVFPLSAAHAIESFAIETETRIYNPEKSFGGYFMPSNYDMGGLFGGGDTGNTSYLMDMEGYVVKKWDAIHGWAPRIMADGTIWGGSYIHDWDGNVIWQYTTAPYRAHHGWNKMWNKKLNKWTMLVLCNRAVTHDELVAMGWDPSIVLPDARRAGYDFLAEITLDTKEIVWEWFPWHHGAQSQNPAWANYVDDVKNAPNKFDVFWMIDNSQPATTGTGGTPGVAGPVNDWWHVNSIDYDEDTGHIVVNPKHWSDFFVIDHDKTFVSATDWAANKAAAAGPAGDLIYRWGNPSSYNWGVKPGWMTEGDSQMYGSHDIQFIDKYHWEIPRLSTDKWPDPRTYTKSGVTLPGGGNFMIFDNGCYNPAGMRSRVLEINGRIGASGAVEVPLGQYIWQPVAGYQPYASSMFGAARDYHKSKQLVWSFASATQHSFYSSHISGQQRLPNGNTHITAGNQGHFFEVTPSGEVVWEYLYPGIPGSAAGGILGGGFNKINYDKTGAAQCYRSYRYSADHPAFTGKTLERIDTLSGRLPRLVGSSDTYPTPVTYFGFGIGGAGTVGGGGGVGGGTGGGGGGGY